MQSPSDSEILTEPGLIPKVRNEVPLERLNTVAPRGWVCTITLPNLLSESAADGMMESLKCKDR